MSNLEEFTTARHWDITLRKEFEKESDRAAVILTSSMLDSALTSLLRSFLVDTPNSEDELIERPNAPLSTFSAKIDISRRLGLISNKFCRDLHIIRRIRNEFAHNIAGCSFSDTTIRSRVFELCKSSGIIERNPKKRKDFPDGPRGDFLVVSSWMLFHLHSAAQYCEQIKEPDLEWGYDTTLNEELSEKLQENNDIKNNQKK